jgi:hypothetical protein
MSFSDSATTTGFSERDFRAVKEFLIRSTVPLIFEDGDLAGVHGSGALFDLDGDLYFVTAGHVLQGVDPTKIGVPVRTHDDFVFTLGRGQVGWSRNEQYDVAAYRIDDSEAAAALRAANIVLGPNNIGAPDPNLDRYVVVGYPAATVTKNGDNLTTKDLTQIYTTLYTGEVIGSNGAHDLFLKLTREAKSLWGQPREVPALPGISGGPVWQIRPSTSTVWTPESALALVGIQVSTDPRAERYIRALRWEVVLAAVKALAPGSPPQP